MEVGYSTPVEAMARAAASLNDRDEMVRREEMAVAREGVGLPAYAPSPPLPPPPPPASSPRAAPPPRNANAAVVLGDASVKPSCSNRSYTPASSLVAAPAASMCACTVDASSSCAPVTPRLDRKRMPNMSCASSYAVTTTGTHTHTLPSNTGE